MMHRTKVLGLAAVLLAAACTPDGSTTGPTLAADGGRRQALSTTEVVPDSLVIFPPVVIGGDAGTPSGTVYVSTTASIDRVLQVTSDNPAVLPFLSTGTTVPAGTMRAGVQLLPATVSVETVVTVFVTGAGVTVSAKLTVEPPGTTLPPPVLASYSVSPNNVAAGTTSTGTVALTSPAPAGGVVIQLGSWLPLTASVPTTVTVPGGATTATFPIATYPGFANSTTSVRLSAKSVNNVVESAITVTTGSVPPPPLDIASIAVSPTSLVGGNAVQGTVTLTGAAPSGGTVVNLASTSTVATTPASVTVRAGATSASFTIPTTAVTAETYANISGNVSTGWLTTTLAVTPPVSGPPATPSLLTPAADARFAAGSTITFDWSDASNAASYTIQISDTDKWTSFLVSQNVSASQYTAAGLPTKTLWWRVRANSASGTSSAWSEVRRFELK